MTPDKTTKTHRSRTIGECYPGFVHSAAAHGDRGGVLEAVTLG